MDDDTTPSLDNTHDTRSLQDNSRMQIEWDGVGAVVQQVIISEGLYGNENEKLASCYDVTHNDAANEIEIDFGDGCETLGITRSGKINVLYTGKYREEGTVITATLENYVSNGNPLEGTRTVTNKGENAEGHIEYGIKVDDAKITFDNGDEITWSSDRTRLWVEGQDTPMNIQDNVYKVFGSSSGINRNEEAFDISIPEADPLHYDMSCWQETQLPVSGQFALNSEGLINQWMVDYGHGEGECNRTVQVNIGSSISFEVDLNQN